MMRYIPRVGLPVEVEFVTLGGLELAIVAFDGAAHAVPAAAFELFFEPTVEAEGELRRRMGVDGDAPVAVRAGADDCRDADTTGRLTRKEPMAAAKAWNALGLNPKPLPTKKPAGSKLKAAPVAVSDSANGNRAIGICDAILKAVGEGEVDFTELCERLPTFETSKLSSNLFGLRKSGKVDRDGAGVYSLTEKGRAQCK